MVTTCTWVLLQQYHVVCVINVENNKSSNNNNHNDDDDDVDDDDDDDGDDDDDDDDDDGDGDDDDPSELDLTFTSYKISLSCYIPEIANTLTWTSILEFCSTDLHTILEMFQKSLAWKTTIDKWNYVSTWIDINLLRVSSIVTPLSRVK